MKANEYILEHWRNRIGSAVNTMDEKGRRNEGNNSRMLWNKDWDFVRNEMFEVIEAMNIYINNRYQK